MRTIAEALALLEIKYARRLGLSETANPCSPIRYRFDEIRGILQAGPMI